MYTFAVDKIHYLFIRLLQITTKWAVARPNLVLFLIPTLSILSFSIGMSTHFRMETDEKALWTPHGSKSLENGNWLSNESGFPVENKSAIDIIIHSWGGNILGKEGIDRAFEAVNTVRDIPGLSDIHSIRGVTNFFNDDYSNFRIAVSNDDEAISVVSASFFPDGDLVDRGTIFGFASPEGGRLTSAKSYPISIMLPGSLTKTFESHIIERLQELRDDWDQVVNNSFGIEFVTFHAYSEEFIRAVKYDMRLLAIAFVAMCVFSCSVYLRCDKVRSSCLLLGVGSVVTVLFSLMTVFGFLFICGVPFTNLTVMLPFIVMGIGIDDAFIITGSFRRTDPSLSIEDRMMETMKDCGVSIVVTTLTTAVAFSLGITSDIPAIKKFNMFAAPCVLVDFIYQVTFFISIVAVNERRIESKRLDCLFCFKSNAHIEDEDERVYPEPSLNDMLMRRYGKALMGSKHAKIWIIITFLALTIFSAFSCSQLKLSFSFIAMVPSDSFIKSYADTLHEYTEAKPYYITVIFRDVDFADPFIREQMMDYVHDLVALPSISDDQPKLFWLNDFEHFVTKFHLEGSTFREQLDLFLGVDVYHKLYSNQIVRSEDGDMSASAVVLYLDIEIDDAGQQVQFLSSQSRITLNQTINMNSEKCNFFTFAPSYYMWDFFSATTEELVLSTILGLAAVAAITLLFVPHPSACAFISLMVAMIYIDVLGVIQLTGFSINPVTFISLVMSIGIMVDYVLHVGFKYFESDASSREGKVLDCLNTIGSSVLLGGTSTVLSTIPLAFSTSTVFLAVFVIFFSFVVISLLHGLVLLPVLLSLFGPMDTVQQQQEDRDEDAVVLSNVRKETGSTEDYDFNGASFANPDT
jgi:Niemann-Pick C1 protein